MRLVQSVDSRPTLLVISYYWPPAAGPGTVRPVKLVKYLADRYRIIVYTASNNQQFGRDVSLENDIPPGVEVITEHVPMQKNVEAGQTFVADRSLRTRFKQWVRGNVLLPDAKRFWLRRAKRTVSNLFTHTSIDAIIVSAPPQTTHLIGRMISRTFNKPVIHDWRDPWTDAFFLQDFPRSRWANWIDRRMERSVIESGRIHVTLNEELTELIHSKTTESVDVRILPNGFDDEIAPYDASVDRSRIIYTGTLAASQRVAVLPDIIRRNPELSMDFYGQVHANIQRDFSDLSDQVTFHPPVSRDTVRTIQIQAGWLLLVIPNTPHSAGILSLKLFDYLASGRPILAFGPVGGAADRILRETGTGFMLSMDADAEFVIDHMNSFQYLANVEEIMKYHRKSQADKMHQMIQEIINDSAVATPDA